MKNKAGSVINNLPGLVKRQFIDLKNIREDNIEPLIETQDGILNNLEGKIKPYDSLLCFYVVSKSVTSLLTDWRCPKVHICLVVELLFYNFHLDVNQEANINDGGEETSGAMTINNEVFDETHINYISILFSFAQPNVNFYYT